jgi:dipeptidase E
MRGETFVLLAEVHRTGQLALIRERVQAGVPFGGSSAGANVAGLVIGTTNDFPVAEIPSREALALLPVSINPHHPVPAQKTEFGARVGKIRAYLQFNPEERVLALADASILRLHQGRAALVSGRGWLYTKAGQRELQLNVPVAELSASAARP